MTEIDTLVGNYDPGLVFISFAIAFSAAYIAIDLAGRVTERTNQLWLIASAITLGIGIWSVHLIGLMAYKLPLTIVYSPTIILLSMIVAIGASGAALFITKYKNVGKLNLIMGSFFLGGVIVTIYISDIAAMQVEINTEVQTKPIMLMQLFTAYDFKIIVGAVAIAVSISLAALGLAFKLKSQTIWGEISKRIGSAFLMGGAITGMHYTGMAAVRIAATNTSIMDGIEGIDSFRLAMMIGCAVIFVLIVTLIASLFEQRISGNIARNKALKESEERFRSLVQNASDIIAVIATDGTFSYISASIKRILNYQPEEWLGKKAFEFVHAEEQEIVKNLLARSLQLPDVDISQQFRIQKSCGCWRYFEVIFNNQIKEPSIAGIAITYRDITERKQTEAVLQQSEQQFRQLTENIQAVFWINDLLTNKVIYVSPAFEQIWGLTCESVYKNPTAWLEVVHPQDRQRVSVALAKKQYGEYEQEYRILRPDGSMRWIRDRGFPIFNQQGEVYRITGIAEDITKRKQQEERLRLLESVVVHANDSVIITEAEPLDSPGPRILYVNEAFTRITGYTPEEVIGKNPRILQGPKTDRAVLEKIRTALTQWQPVVVELINYRKNGSEFWVELSIVPVADETGWYTHWVAVERDITDRKQVEVETHKALLKEKELNELKSRFIAMTSHEFRTPLATILASSDLLKQFSHKLTEEKKQERLNKIQIEVKNMTKLLDDILIFGKAEAEKIDFNPSWINLKQFCLGILEEIEISLAGKHYVKFNYYGERERDYLDEKLLRHILSNVLSNAIKYSPLESTIYFELIWQEKQIIFKIEDKGIGIPVADRKRLFEPFHRGSNVGNIPGTGLGLAIINNAIKLHQGRITIDSEVNRGTTFTIYIPIAEIKD